MMKTTPSVETQKFGARIKTTLAGRFDLAAQFIRLRRRNEIIFMQASNPMSPQIDL